MRRKDREITNPDEIFDILQRCDTLCIGFSGGEYPYVVPVSFGALCGDGGTVIYFHCAREGQKVDMLALDSRVCVEGHIFYKTETTHFGITARYESIIGFGIAQKAEGEEITLGLKAITEHYNYPDFPIDRCTSLPVTAVYKITLNSLTGKSNLPQQLPLK